MGKAKNKKKNSYRHNPLLQEISDERYATQSSRNKVRRKQLTEDTCVDNRLSSKILKQAHQQKEEIDKEFGFSDSNTTVPSSLGSNDPLQDERDDDELPNFSGTDYMEEIKISEEDEEAFKTFMTKDMEKRSALADILKETLTEKRTEIYTLGSETQSIINVMPQENINLYKNLAPFLKNYSSGKLPAAFKCIPQFSNWEQILQLTEPDKWSAATMFHATRIFCSNLPDKKAQRFYNLILLPRLRDDIAESKVLNTHLYEALKKALFKPTAFFKGIILPLCQAGNCNLREATIFSSVIAKLSIPILHSSAALLKIADMTYSGANSIFMRVLLEKKYALPLQVVNSVTAHFLRFMDDKTEYPLLWHQCLLTFVQIYKNDLSVEQRHKLLQLLTVHRHQHVTDVIRRELQSINNGNVSVCMDVDSKGSD